MGDGFIKAIVIADDHYNGLGVIRSLGEQNVPVILVLTSDGSTVIDKSKYVNSVIRVRHSSDEIVDALQRIIKDDHECAIYPLSDFAAVTIDEHRDLFKNCGVPHANGKMRELMNKHTLAGLFKEKGVLVPYHEEIIINDLLDLKWDRYPAIIKPLASVEGMKTDIVTVRGVSEAQDALSTLRLKGYSRVLIEEFVTAKDEFMIEVLGYVDKSGEPHFSKVVHKIREYPISNGSTAYAFFDEEAEYIDFDALRKAVIATGYYGVFDIEYKYANGKAYFIEMNFRNGAPAYAVTMSGFNIAYEWLCDFQGKPFQATSSAKNMHFMCEHRDVFNMVKGEVPLFKWLNEYITSEKLIWNWKDMRPSRILYVNVLKTTFRRLLHGRR